MKKNLGSTDKVIRYILAIVFILIALLGNINVVLRSVLFSASAVLIGTSLLSFCPLYAIVGLKTCKNEQ
jgi:hypothetical protein